jgi:hypothetical protein
MIQPLPNQRHLFDIPPDVTYINCAYLSPLLRSVHTAGAVGLARKFHPWTIVRCDFFNEVERARAGFARLIGAQADDIAITPSSSYGAATAAANAKDNRSSWWRESMDPTCVSGAYWPTRLVREL